MEHDSPAALIDLAGEHLRARRVLRPPVDTLTRMIATARADAHRRIEQLLADELADGRRGIGLSRGSACARVVPLDKEILMRRTPRPRSLTIAGACALAGAVVLALALTGPAPVGAQPSKRDRGCHPLHTRTLAATAHARVFASRRFIPETRTRVTYGCLLSRTRPFRFYRADFPTGFAPIALAGRYVAYGAYSDCAASFCDPNSVVLQDLKNGKVRLADGPLRVADVSDLVLRAKGSLAWIGTSFDAQGAVQPGVQVVKAERGQPPVVLDAGLDVARGSLALAGTRLYWTKAGRPVSAPLG